MMSSVDAANIGQLVILVCIFPYTAYFFKKNERLHAETQKSQSLQDTQIAVLKVQVAIINARLGLPNDVDSTV